MLDFRIETFITVCRHMNFTKAAEELAITQPAVSQHIHYLEDSYHIKLFEYQGKKMKLTPQGTVFLNAATTMKHDDIYLREKLGQMENQGLHLVFGVTLTVGEFVIPGHIAQFLMKYPDTSLKMAVSNTKELLTKINSGEIDFALVEGFFAKSEYDYLVYSRERYIGICKKGYQFHKKVQVIEDLLDERMIIREAGSGTREILEKYMEGRNFKIQDFNNLTEISNISAIKSLVKEGCGITFLYEAAVREELKEGSLEMIPLKDFNVSHDLTFIWRRNSIFSEYYHELFSLLHDNL